MQYRVLGRTGLRVSEVGLGGEWFNGLTPEASIRLLDAAEAGGINFLDIYMPEAPTRDNLGHALVGRREKFIIQGHLCAVCEDGQYARSRDIGKTKEAFEDLLQRLHTDYIDIGMLHYVDSDQDYEAVFHTEIICYARELKEKGVIRFLGLSSHNPKVALRAVRTGLIDVLLFSINPAYDLERPDATLEEMKKFSGLDRSALVVDESRQILYSACEAAEVAITVMKPLASGTLLKAESSPFGVPLTVAQCIHYCLDRNGVKSVLVGCATPDEVAEAVRYDQVSPEEKDYSHIYSTGVNFSMNGRCMYCNHCQPCPAHIDVAAVTKFLDLAASHEKVPETVMQHYWALSTTAEDCLECGQCEPNCPFGVPVRENMRRARERFKRG